MKKYAVSLDITVSKTIYVKARDKNEAESIALKLYDSDSYGYARNPDACVSREVTDVYEDNY